jgi:hypothetical protein
MGNTFHQKHHVNPSKKPTGTVTNTHLIVLNKNKHLPSKPFQFLDIQVLISDNLIAQAQRS